MTGPRSAPQANVTAWRILSSKSLIQDRWIDVRADRCLTPSGAEISPYYVLTYPDWVHVVALTRQQDLVLVKQYRHAAGRGFLELPAGVMETTDPNPEAAARRELSEETGYVSDRWLHVASLYPNPAMQTNRVHTFLALDAVAQDRQRLEAGEEGLSAMTVPVSDVLDALRDGILGQATHVSSLLLAARLMERTPV